VNLPKKAGSTGQSACEEETCLAVDFREKTEIDLPPKTEIDE
jgi:hypothetical protein